MKPHNLTLFSLPLAAAVALSSCKKKPEVVTGQTPTTPTPAAEKPAEEAPPVVVVPPVDRASKLGFAQMLPKDTSTLVLLQHGDEVAKRFKGSKLYAFMEKQNPSMTEPDPTEATGGVTAMDILGNEFFLATGKTTAEQSKNLMTFSGRSNYFQTRSTLKMIISSLQGGEMDMSDMEPGAMVANFIKDPKSGIDLLKKSEMPAIYAGCKPSAESKEKVMQTFAGFTANLAMAGAAVEEISFEVDGRKFSGNQLSGKKLVEELQADQAMMENLEESLDEETRKELFSVVAEKNLIAVTGEVNGYVVLFVGSRKEDLKFAATPAESLAASPALSFVDPYLEKNPITVAYSEQGVLEGLSSSNGFSDIAEAIRDAIGGNGKIDTREIEAMLDVISERQKDLMSLSKFSTFGAVAMLDEGFKLETFGGSNMPNIQPEVTNKMGALGSAPDVAVFANWTSNAAYGVKMNAYLESLVETAYSVTKNISTWEVEENPSFDQFKSMFTMFEENFSDDAVQVWQSLNGDMSDGLGNETAFVIDLNGEMPPIPNVPQELVKDGKFPRISWVKPVKDRSKLVSAWGKINTSGENIMKQVSAMMEQEQAMPKPMSSKDNGLITWFFAGPLFTDDFAPSVTLNDKWFVASTSKNQGVNFVNQAAASNTGKTGAFLSVDFDALRKCGKHWVDAVDKNKDAVFKDNESAKEDFTENKQLINDGLEALSELDEMSLHSRKESNVERTSLHLKTRK